MREADETACSHRQGEIWSCKWAQKVKIIRSYM